MEIIFSSLLLRIWRNSTEKVNLELERGTFLFISNTSEDHVTMMIVTSLIFKFVDMNVELLH